MRVGVTAGVDVWVPAGIGVETTGVVENVGVGAAGGVGVGAAVLVGVGIALGTVVGAVWVGDGAASSLLIPGDGNWSPNQAPVPSGRRLQDLPGTDVENASWSTSFPAASNSVSVSPADSASSQRAKIIHEPGAIGWTSRNTPSSPDPARIVHPLML